jgi:hypothetical protein
MRKIIILLLLLSASVAYAGTTYNPFTGKQDKCMTIEETDGSPANVICGKLKVGNGTMTDNGDGTFTLAIGAGGGDMNAAVYDTNSNSVVDAVDAVSAGGINWTDVYIPDSSVNWSVQVPLNETDEAHDACSEISGCVVGAITAAGVPAAETDAAHDTCGEISGCVVGAITAAGVPAAETDAAHDTCAEISGCVVGAQAGDSTLTDIADGTITENLVNTANPWANNEVADDITAGTAAALAADPSDCAANQFATTIAASGNLGCAAIADADVPNDITITEADPQVGTLENTKWCTSNGTLINCQTDAPGGAGDMTKAVYDADTDNIVDNSEAVVFGGINWTDNMVPDASINWTVQVPLAETDPQVGSLTNTKWCTTDGSAVNCTTDAPSGSGDVLGPATNTADKLPQWNGADSKTLKDGLAVDASGACAAGTACGGGHTHPPTLCTANITSDLPAAIDPSGCDILSITSDNTTNTNRTFCIAAGVEGQVLTVMADGPGANEIDLDDGAGGSCAGSTGAAQYLDGDWPPFSSQADDTLIIIYHVGANTGWFETSRSAN